VTRILDVGGRVHIFQAQKRHISDFGQLSDRAVAATS
jgi:hypothetical protein